MKKTNLKKRWICFAAAGAVCLVIGFSLSGCSQKIEESVLKSEMTEEKSETVKGKSTLTVSDGKEKTAVKEKKTPEPDKKLQKNAEPSESSAVKDDKNRSAASKEETKRAIVVKKEEKPPETASQESSVKEDGDHPAETEKTEEPETVEVPVQNSETPEPAKEEHHHAYYIVGETAPTCTSAGKRTYACSCGLTYDDPIFMIDHDWVPVTEIVHHDAEIKPAWDEQVSEAWDEPVYENHSICNGCGIDLDVLEQNGMDRDDHIWEEHDGMNGWHDEKVQVDTIHHEAETVHHPEEIISPAWDEEIVTGYCCSVCGTVK